MSFFSLGLFFHMMVRENSFLHSALFISHASTNIWLSGHLPVHEVYSINVLTLTDKFLAVSQSDPSHADDQLVPLAR